MLFRNRLLIGLFCALLLIGCEADRAAVVGPTRTGPVNSSRSEQGRTVVVWISVDGVRPDYLDRAPTPLLDRMMREGAFSMRMDPGFPSLTFPSHVAQATGVGAELHGITGNGFYDSRRGGRPIYYPDNPAMLQAEPIWHTAPRQGVRTAVFDWPLCHGQEGPVRSDYFTQFYDRDLSDEQRLGRLIDTWRDDRQGQPLRLLMGYIPTVDSTGHEHGPDSPEVEAAMAEADVLLQRIFERARALFAERMTENDRLYFIVTTDHGMSKVHTLVNLRALIGIDLPRSVQTVNSGNVANIHLDHLEEAERAEMAEAILDALKDYDFLQAYRRENLPEEWAYRHPQRVGDVVIVLEEGYTYSARLPLVTYPVEEVGSPLGMHGYSAAKNPEMMGIAIFWSSAGLGGRDLGPIEGKQLHTMVAHILGIDPAEAAAPAPAELLGQLKD